MAHNKEIPVSSILATGQEHSSGKKPMSRARDLDHAMLSGRWNNLHVMHTSQAKRMEIPENKVVLCSITISNNLLALTHQMVTKGNCVCLDLLDIGLEYR